MWGNTFVVTNTADSGLGTLRWAITNANTTPGTDTIAFRFNGAKPYTINLASALPSVTDPVIIDGTTQTNYAGTPVVELNGTSAGSGAVGLQLNSAFNTVKGLAINRFQGVAGMGMVLSGVSNVIQGNFIGTDTTGTIARGNGSYGISVKSAGNLIGGINASNGNLISGGNDTGIYVLNANGNVIQGNWIGISHNGTSALGNVNNGITLDGTSTGNLIGGTTAGARNILSGNGQSGLFLNAASVTGNLVEGNYLGTDVSGSLVVSNFLNGIEIQNAPGNTIGPGNVISGNRQHGLFINGSGARSNTVSGNYIGTDATGSVALGNRTNGVTIYLGAGGNVIGGTSAGAGNVISGNVQYGVLLTGGANGNFVQGNFIGLAAGGASALANGYEGVSISGGSSNTIGGVVAGARNVISGNTLDGIGILLITDVVNAVYGNYIGTDITGTKAVPNVQAGIYVLACSNLIGGVAAGSGNVISGNSQQGVWLSGVSGNVTGNVIQGNLIGLDVTGANSLGNGDAGIAITSAARNQIGGASAAARNVIAANSNAGVLMAYTGTTGNLIQGNYIGTDSTGTVGRGNYPEGIYVQDAATNTFGGSAAGAGNLISANNTRGIWLTNSPWNVVQGNFIGTQADGSSALGNGNQGVDLDVGSTNNTIGGTATGAANRIAFAQTIYAGVRVRDGALNNLISANAIFSNGGLGIDLGTNGVNSIIGCESGVAANAANRSQNFPVLSNVSPGSVTRISGTLNSAQSKTYVLQFFASPTGDTSGYGEGQLFLGQTNLTLGSACSSNFTAVLPVTVSNGWVVTATATDPANNTSEFSVWVNVNASSVPPLQLTGVNRTNHQFSLSWTNNGGNYILQQTTNLSPSVSWTTVTNTPALSNGFFVLTRLATNRSTFYRLSAQ